jgi:glycosyltransferase involved in cell wall biosynthesis
MKVLHILNSIEFSGAEIMLKTAAPLLVENGFNLHALSTGEQPGSYAGILSDSGYTIHHIPFRKSPEYFLALFRYLRSERFNVVHIHPERAFFWHALVARAAGVKKIIRTVHSNFTFQGLLRLRRIFQRFIANKILGVRFIAIGPSVYETEKRIFKNDSVIIPNWVDDTGFFPPQGIREVRLLRKKMNIPEADTVIVSVGSCTPLKNHEDIIRAIAEICGTIKNVTYVHVGDGPLQPQEKDLLTMLGIAEKVQFLGQIENVRDVLAASDIFVMTSDYEGLSISKIEAMLCALPMVLYNNLGLRDFTVHGEDGFLIPSDFHELAETLKKIIVDQNLRKKMGEKARTNALQNFNIKQSLTKLMEIYWHN